MIWKQWLIQYCSKRGQSWIHRSGKRQCQRMPCSINVHGLPFQTETLLFCGCGLSTQINKAYRTLLWKYTLRSTSETVEVIWTLLVLAKHIPFEWKLFCCLKKPKPTNFPFQCGVLSIFSAENIDLCTHRRKESHKYWCL